MPSGNRNANSRGQNPAGSSAAGGGTALPPPPPYNPAASRVRRGRNETDSAAGGRGSETANHRRRGEVESGSVRRDQNVVKNSRDSSNGGTDHRRGVHSVGSTGSVPHRAERTTVVVTNQNGERVEGNRNGGRGGGTAPRVVHRVGMECLSPINVARDGPSAGGESNR